MSEFDPGKYLSKVSGADYLEVKFRLLWLRTAHPDAAIETNCESFNETFAVFRAKVSIPGGGSATGWGSEAYNDFRDYIEKAETKALGRALAALGFGTQFCPDFAEGVEQGRIADAPVRRQDAPRDAQPRPQASNGQRTEQAATPRQVQFIAAIARELGMSDSDLRSESDDAFGRDVSALNRRDASIFIERLQQRRMNQGQTAPPARTISNDAPEPYEPAVVDDDTMTTQPMYPPADLAAKHRQ
jgi:hypothetical protein